MNQDSQFPAGRVRRDEIEGVVADIRPLLSHDGADLEVTALDERSGLVELKVVLGEALCSACVVGPDLLERIIRETFQQRTPGVHLAALHDPRMSEVTGSE